MSIGNQNILRSEFGISEQSWTELRRHRITELPNTHKFSKVSFYRVLQLVMFFFFPDSTLRVCAKKIISEKDLIWCLLEIRESSSGILFRNIALFFETEIPAFCINSQTNWTSFNVKSQQTKVVSYQKPFSPVTTFAPQKFLVDSSWCNRK